MPALQSEVVIDLAQPLQEATSELERAAIERALKAAGGNNDEAAKALGLSRKGLYLKRQRLDLK
jgi:DNA-binding NtrC family response regulator